MFIFTDSFCLCQLHSYLLKYDCTTIFLFLKILYSLKYLLKIKPIIENFAQMWNAKSTFWPRGRLQMTSNRSSNAQSVQFSSVAQACLTLWPHGLQHARPPHPSPTPGVYPNSCPLSWWCHPTISSSVVPFSSCPQSFPASGSFQMSQFFSTCG